MAKSTAKKLPSGQWNILVYDHTENGKRKYQSFTAPTKSEVEFMASRFKKEKKEGAKSISRTLTVANVVDQYIANADGKISPSTMRGYRTYRDNGFKDLMGKSVHSLALSDVQHAIDEEQKRRTKKGNLVAPHYVKNEWGLIAAALKAVCNKEFYVELPEIPRKRNRDELLPEPVDILKAVAGTDVELACKMVMFCGGMRMSELRGLKYEDIDFKKNKIYIERVKIKVDDHDVVKEIGKTKYGLRAVTLTEEVAAFIKNSDGYKEYLNTGENDYIIKMNYSQLYNKYKRIMTRNNLFITFHDLRHVYASICITVLNIPLRVVAIEGGWSENSPILLKLYNDGFKSIYNDSMNKLNAYCTDENNKCKTAMQDGTF